MTHYRRIPLIMLVLLVFALTTLLAGGPQPANADPTPNFAAPGPYAVTVTDQIWYDAARSRDVPVRIYAPVGAAGPHLVGINATVGAPGPYPVIIFSHGLGGSRAAGETWGRQWASWGFVSVHLQHHGSDGAAIRQATGTIAERFDSAMTADQLVARCKDVTFAIDEIEAKHASKDPIFADVDPAEIGMSGHSFGAQTTLAEAGQQFPGSITLADKRPRAFIAFSPASLSTGNLDQTFGSIAAPFLSITGSQDQIGLLPDITPQNRTLPYAHMAPGDKYLLWLDTATHMSFDGQPFAAMASLMLGPIAGAPQAMPDQAHINVVVKGVTTAFWFAYLTPDTTRGKEAKTWLTREGPQSLLKPKDRWEMR